MINDSTSGHRSEGNEAGGHEEGQHCQWEEKGPSLARELA